MTRIAGSALALLLIILLFLSDVSLVTAQKSSSSSQWKITSIKICRTPSGAPAPAIDALGVYPVYSFFIPRPVWTVNGNLVEAAPLYQHGRLTAFQLLGAAAYLKPGAKNTIKFSLPDQNSSKTFTYDENKPAPGQCWEYF